MTCSDSKLGRPPCEPNCIPGVVKLLVGDGRWKAAPCFLDGGEARDPGRGGGTEFKCASSLNMRALW